MRWSKQDTFFLNTNIRSNGQTVGPRVHAMPGDAGPSDWGLSTNPQLYIIGMYNVTFVGPTTVRIAIEYTLDGSAWLRMPGFDTGDIAIANTTPRIFWNQPWPALEALLNAKSVRCVCLLNAAATAGTITVGYKDGPAEIRQLGVDVVTDRERNTQSSIHGLGRDRDALVT